LTLRRQPEGTFKSQDQEGRGDGRSSSGISGGHATGGYAVQLAANRHHIELTGAGYNTNDFWLTEQELADLEFAHKYEGGTAGAVPEDFANMTTAELMSHLDCFCPAVAIKVSDALKLRLPSEPVLLTNLINVVMSPAEKAHKRVAALRTLGTNNVLVQAEIDTWFYPSKGYVYNWGAANYGCNNVTSWTNILGAITQFDRDVPFDMLTANKYTTKIYTMATNQLDSAGMELYYNAAAIILSPDCGGTWWVDSQQVRNWNPLIIARYADKIMRTAELNTMVYDAPTILKHNQIGEGMHCAMARATEYYTHYGPLLDLAYMDEYGKHWGWYSNYTHVTKSRHIHNQNYQIAKDILTFTCTNQVGPLKWFRYLIQTNVVNTLTNPTTRLADLRANLAHDPDDDLFNAVCLSEIVAHPDNPDPFVDITNHVGFTAAVIASHWRKYRGAVELGIADTNAVSRWLAALAQATASGNDRAQGGILHVLAGKNAPEALAVATNYLHHRNDFVTMAALDVIAHVGTKNELLTVFNNFLTNSILPNTESDPAYKNDFWMYAHWEACNNIITRDYAGCLADVANPMASSFNTYTSNSTWVATVPYSTLVRAEPFSILNPVASPRKTLGYGKCVYAILGRFARDNAACSNALKEVVRLKADSYYDRGHNFHACEALLSNYTVPEIVAIENAGTTRPWNERGAVYYLMDRLLWDEVAPSNQLALLEIYNGLYQVATNRNYIGRTYQLELNNRRGLEETDGVFFFYMK
jgi:hypothetical protein